MNSGDQLRYVVAIKHLKIDPFFFSEKNKKTKHETDTNSTKLKAAKFKDTSWGYQTDHKTTS